MTSSSSSSAPPKFTPHPYQPRFAAGHFPYSDADFTRADSSADSLFYSAPRFVTHIDDGAISRLTAYYASVLPIPPEDSSSTSSSSSSRRPPAVLDLCASHISHYPPSALSAVRAGRLRVLGLGMNADELDRNPLLPRPADRVVHDLNASPDFAASLPPGDGDDGNGDGGGGGQPRPKVLVAAATCAVSVDYLTAPHRVLRALRRVSEEGATVHVALSERCFPTKAVRCWTACGDPEERARMVGDFLWEAGWREVEWFELEKEERRGGGQEEEGGAQGWLRALLAGGSGDRIWVVRGRNVSSNAGTGGGGERETEK